MRVRKGSNGFRRWLDAAGSDDVPPADVRIVTSGGQSIPTHACVLAMASPVLENMLEQPPKRWDEGRMVPILGVPCDAVLAFVRFLYSTRWRGTWEEEEEMGRHGMQLLVLSHAYRVGWLKRACEEGVGARLTAAEVVDALQLARRCDAPRLYVLCMRFIWKDLAAVETTEAWSFLQARDPHLELEILQSLHDIDMRKKQWRRRRAEQEVYLQLSEAMECLHHICTEGCTDVGPSDGNPSGGSKGPCPGLHTCQGLQHLIRHFAACIKKAAPGGCIHCKRMWQLFRLHSDICDEPEPCKVPLCKQFKTKMHIKGKEDETWRLLARKVITARVMSSLANRKREDYIHKPWIQNKGRTKPIEKS